MHEYSLMERLIEEVTENLNSKGINQPGSVSEIALRLGVLELHSEESFRQAFTMITKGTLLEGAKLDLEIIPARIQCTQCGYKGPIGVGEADCHDPSPVVECPKCGVVCSVQGGRGVDPIELEINEPAP